MSKTGMRVDDHGNVPTATAVHWQTHQGRMFHSSVANASLANGASINVLIQVGAVACHTRFSVAAGAAMTAFLYEGTTFSVEGTAVLEANKNRGSANVATAEVTHTPTLTLDGTLLTTILIPGGSRAQAVGGSGANFEEWILAPNTAYLLRVTNGSGAAAAYSINLDWYEPKKAV